MAFSDTKRIIALDLLRGYLLFFIIVDHLGRFPGLFDIFTGRGWLWVSASEGFFFISGLMVGYVRGRQIGSLGFKTILKKVWRRATELYIWSVSLTLGATALVVLLGRLPGTKEGLPYHIQWARLILDTLTLHYVYGWADFLPHYVIFMFFAPVALYLLSKKAAWVVVLGSLLLWLGRDRQFELAWQLLFFGGIVVGYYLPAIESWAWQLQSSTRRYAYRSVIGLTLATMTVNVALMYGLPLWHQRFSNLQIPWLQKIISYATKLDLSIGPYFDKYSLAPGRVVMFCLWFLAFYITFRRYENWLQRTVGRFLLPLGQHSLLVYGIHSFVLLIINLMIPRAVSWPANISINLAALAVIWIATIKSRFLLQGAGAELKSLFSAKPQSTNVPLGHESFSSRRRA